MGVDARSNYLEKGQVATDPLKITCGVCHDPHNATNPGQLRLPIDVADEKQNLCMSCHHKRGEPDLGTGGTTTRGAHSPEGPMLLGEAGWWPPGMPTGGLERIVSTHGTEANPRLCAGCHVEQYEVTDKVTGDFQLQVVGHKFLAIPCVDASGAPVSTDCGTDLTQRRFTTCATSGCHASQDQARSAFVIATNRIVSLNNQLKALLARVPRSEFSSTDARFTTAEGAQFNTTLADKRGSQVHNPFLMEALLVGSIDAVKLTYNLQ
jgi:predicted CXXCH cytochrome family protein